MQVHCKFLVLETQTQPTDQSAQYLCFEGFMDHGTRL